VVAIAVHNVLKGLTISLVLVLRGVGVGRAALWSVFSRSHLINREGGHRTNLASTTSGVFSPFLRPILVRKQLLGNSLGIYETSSSVPQQLMASPAFASVEAFRPLLPYGLGFAAGAMVWMVFAELLPDARKEAPDRLFALVLALSVAAMVAFRVLIR
jgi:zinc transporter ZupT